MNVLNEIYAGAVIINVIAYPLRIVVCNVWLPGHATVKQWQRVVVVSGRVIIVIEWQCQCAGAVMYHDGRIIDGGFKYFVVFMTAVTTTRVAIVSCVVCVVAKIRPFFR